MRRVSWLMMVVQYQDRSRSEHDIKAKQSKQTNKHGKDFLKTISFFLHTILRRSFVCKVCRSSLSITFFWLGQRNTVIFKFWTSQSIALGLRGCTTTRRKVDTRTLMPAHRGSEQRCITSLEKRFEDARNIRSTYDPDISVTIDPGVGG